jgi:hypothetical protein
MMFRFLWLLEGRIGETSAMIGDTSKFTKLDFSSETDWDFITS